jgi:hypothetical protein
MMKSFVIAAALFFTLALALRLEASTDDLLDPSFLDFVVGLSERDVVAMRRDLVELHLEIKQMESQAGSAENPQQMRAEMQGRIKETRRRLTSQLTTEQLASVHSLSPDPQTRENQLKERVLNAPDLSPDQHRALTELLQIAGQLEQDEYTRGRFWLLTSLILTPGQMVAVKSQLPYTHQTQPRPENFFDLPELEPSQANRVLSAFTNLESETTATRVQAQTIERNLKDSNDEEQKMAAMKEMLEIRAEMCDLRESATAELKTHFAAEQLKHYDAAPPFGSLGQQKNLGEWMVNPEHQNSEQKSLSMPDLQLLHKDWQEVKSTVESQSKDMPEPQSPQGMTAMAELRNLVRPLERRRLEIARRIAPFLDTAQMEAYLRTGANQ